VSKTLAALEELQDDESLLALIYNTALVEDPIEFEKRVADETGEWMPAESLDYASRIHCRELASQISIFECHVPACRTDCKS
jgi:hypothetical protein